MNHILKLALAAGMAAVASGATVGYAETGYYHSDNSVRGLQNRGNNPDAAGPPGSPRVATRYYDPSVSGLQNRGNNPDAAGPPGSPPVATRYYDPSVSGLQNRGNNPDAADPPGTRSY